jgi:hypothetical protein
MCSQSGNGQAKAPLPEYTELPNYEYLLKWVKRRLGKNFEIVREPGNGGSLPRPHLERSEGSYPSFYTAYARAPPLSIAESQQGPIPRAYQR